MCECKSEWEDLERGVPILILQRSPFLKILNTYRGRKPFPFACRRFLNKDSFFSDFKCLP